MIQEIFKLRNNTYVDINEIIVKNIDTKSKVL